jgi:hypothetical protein
MFEIRTFNYRHRLSLKMRIICFEIMIQNKFLRINKFTHIIVIYSFFMTEKIYLRIEFKYLYMLMR